MNLKPLGANKTELTLQTEIGPVRVLFSYQTPVAMIDSVGSHYVTEKKWSRTTSKHITQWIDSDKFALMPQSFFDNLATKVKLPYASINWTVK